MTYDIMMYANFLRIFGAQLVKGKLCQKILKIWESWKAGHLVRKGHTVSRPPF